MAMQQDAAHQDAPPPGTSEPRANGVDQRRGVQCVLRDVRALEAMLARGLFESDRRRIGAEQEMVLVDRSLRPAPVSREVLEEIDDERLTHEIGRFNVEYNCDPIDLAGSCLSDLRDQLTNALRSVVGASAPHGARPLLTGICPTVDLSHLTRANLTQKDRYFALDDALRRLRGEDYELRIDGADELIVRHPTVMLEAANTSFQIHYQTSPESFAADYNVALATAAPVLAAGVNSPVLFGKRLWRETRIAIFQQVVDSRTEGAGQRNMLGRVRFGESWIDKSVVEIFRADVARFRQILSTDPDSIEDPEHALAEGRAPKLTALQMFNSSVYRWMRPCYGVTCGRPHLRIENRVLPAGPTVEDEVANAGFWIGLMNEGPRAWPDLADRLDFRDARGNFNRAAREGLAGHMAWLDRDERPITELISDVFLPAALRGLENAGIDHEDIARVESIIGKRVATRRTGSHWALDSIAKMRGKGTREQRLDSLTRAMLDQQASGKPVHEWALAEFDEEGGVTRSFATVSQCMTTDLYTVGEDECIDLVASIMDWERLRHVPVETDKHELIGLVSYRALLRTLARRKPGDDPASVSVSEIMVRNPVTVSPDTPTLDAIALMSEHRVACLPVVEDGRLVGILSERDYTHIARQLLERALRRGTEA